MMDIKIFMFRTATSAAPTAATFEASSGGRSCRNRLRNKQAGSKRYKDAWRALNLLIRSDGSWSGRERNTCYLNDGKGGFGNASFVSGLDFAGDGRAFVPLDIDHDGDLDLILKFRTAPQIRVLRNDFCRDGGACPPSTC